MKNKIWSPSFFLEMIRQTKIIGILSVIIAAIFSSIRPLELFSMQSRGVDIDERLIQYNELGFFGYSFYLFIFISVILTASLFKYFNKRTSSDFFHSIPISRNCYFLTALSVVITWIALSIVISVLCSNILYSLIQISIPTSVVFNSAFVLFSIAILISGCLLLSLSLSGTKLSNTVLFLLIFAGPRLIITMINYFIEVISVVFDPNVFPFSGNIYNIPFYMIFNIMDASKEINAFNNIPSMIYTLVLGIIYITAALFIMKFRKSEIAENAAPNKYMRHVYSVLISFVVSIVFVYFHVTLLNLVLITVVTFFLFEAIFSKNIKKTFSSAPFFIFVIALDALVFFSVIDISSFTLNNKLYLDQVEEVGVYSDGYSFALSDYIDFKLTKIKVNDDELKRRIVYEYNNTLERIKNKEIEGYNYSYDFVVKMKDGNERKIKMFGLAGKELYDMLYDYVIKQNDDLAFPDDLEIKDICLNNLSENFDMGVNFSDNEIKELWSLYKQEFKSADKAQRENMLIKDGGVWFSVYVEHGNKSGYYYYITNDFPETAERLYEMIREKNRTDILDNIISGKINSYLVQCCVFNHPNRMLDLYYSFSFAVNNKTLTDYQGNQVNIPYQEFINSLKIFRENVNKEIDLSRSVLIMKITPLDSNNSFPEQNFLFQISDMSEFTKYL